MEPGIITLRKSKNTSKHYINSKYPISFISIGILLQLIPFIFNTTEYNWITWVSLISGISGVISVVLVSIKSMYQFIPSFLQLGTYGCLSWYEKLWGEFMVTIFFIVMMILALSDWLDNRKGCIVRTEKLNFPELICLGIYNIILIFIFWKALIMTSDPQPLMDSITTIPAMVAQVLMTYRYREQWIFWIIIDIASIWMWYIADNLFMVSQYIFWTINCIYGWYMWSRK